MRAIGLMAFVLAGFVFLTNPLNGVPGVDSSIFLYVARRLGEGAAPYLEVFDQKGPLLYFIDWVGWQGGVLGMWVLDLLAMGWFLYLARRVARGGGVATAAILLVAYHCFACGGNMPEMWIMAFSMWAYGLTLKPMTRGAALVIGVCLAAIVMLKFNMLAVAIPVGWAMMREFRNDWRKAAGLVFMLMAGAVLVGLPLFAYFAAHDALGAWWEVYVRYNALYASSHSGSRIVMNRGLLIAGTMLALNGYWIWRERGSVSAKLNLAYLLGACGLVWLSGGSVRYYGPILPACVLPLAWGVEKMSAADWRWARVAGLGSVAVLAGMAYQRNSGAQATRQSYAELRELGSCIENRESVTVLGCDCWAYFVLGATCPGRFPFQGTIAACSEEYRRQMIGDLERGISRYLVVPRGAMGTRGFLGVTWAKEVVERRYRVVAKGWGYEIWEGRES